MQMYRLKSVCGAALAAGALIGAGPPASGAQAAPACRTASDQAAFLLGLGRHLVTSTDPRLVQARDQDGIAAMPAASVRVVTDERVCAAAARAYAADMGGRAPGGRPLSGRVYVVQVGRRYLVVDPAWRAGEYHSRLVMNERFEVLSRALH
jgi:hypothetical protein